MSEAIYRTPGNEKTNKWSTSLFVLYSVFTFLVYVLPYTKVVVPYIYAGILMLISLPILMIKSRKRLSYSIILILITGLLFLFNILLQTYPFAETMNEAIRNLRFFLPVLWVLFALEYCNTKQLRAVIISYFVIIAFILYKTLVALESNPWVTRILARSKMMDDPETRAYRLGNVGGFEFAYMMGIITLCLVWTALKSDKKWVKYISILAVLVCYYYIIETMYTTLLILTVIGTIILLMTNIKHMSVKIILLIGLLALIFSLPSLLKYLSDVFSGSLLSTKFMQMHNALTGEGIDALGSRPEHIKTALKIWLQHPVFGGFGGDKKVHSFVFGLLETNGLVGLAFFGTLLYQTYKYIASTMRRMGLPRQLFNVCMLYLIALAFLNPVGYLFEVTIVAFFFVPIYTKDVLAHS